MMFIYAAPRNYILSGKYLEIPNWIRAPLALYNGQKCYFYINDAHLDPNTHDHEEHSENFASHRKSTEIIFTPINPEYWQEVWRLELQIYDHPGQLAKLHKILADNGIRVLYETSRNSFIPEYHVKTMMLDCSSYGNEVDGDPEAKSGKVRKSLFGLESFIKLYFIDGLRINDSGAPRIELSRNHSYYTMMKFGNNLRDNEKEAMREIKHLNSDEFTGTTPEGLNHRGGIDIFKNETEISNSLMRAFPSITNRNIEKNSDIDVKNSYCVFSVNVRSLIGYCRLVPEDAASFNFHLIAKINKDRKIEKISNLLKNNDLNILRSQFSPGKFRSQQNKIEDKNKLRKTISIYFESKVPHEKRYIEYLFETEFSKDIKDGEIEITLTNYDDIMRK